MKEKNQMELFQVHGLLSVAWAFWVGARKFKAMPSRNGSSAGGQANFWGPSADLMGMQHVSVFSVLVM